LGGFGLLACMFTALVAPWSTRRWPAWFFVLAILAVVQVSVCAGTFRFYE
jgi:hypothetical protein